MKSNPANRKKSGNPDTQFKPGQSGNPSGRPKDILTRAVRELVTPEEAKSLAITLLALAHTGDTKAMEMVWNRLEGKAVDRREDAPPGTWTGLDDIPEDAARAVIEASERFTSGSRRASK